MLSVADALAGVLASLPCTNPETIAVPDSIGRVLAQDAVSHLDLPPAAVSSMDGYAVRAADCSLPGAIVTRIGESAAGHPFAGAVGAGQAVRIFTGAILPDGADSIILQEDVTAASEADGTIVTIKEAATKGRFIRPAGLDANAGDIILEAGTIITARAMALLLATGHTQIDVRRKPAIGILSTGEKPGLTSILFRSNTLQTACVCSTEASLIVLIQLEQ